MKQLVLAGREREALLLTSARQSAPIRIGLAFSVLTFLIFLLGPWKFRSQDDAWLATLFLVYNVAMYLGFHLGARMNVRFESCGNSLATRRMFLRLGSTVFAVTAITLVPRFMIDTGYFGGSFSELVTQVQMGWNEAQTVYAQRQARVAVTGAWKLINVVCVVTSFVAWLYTPITILTWRYLGRARKVFSVVYWLILVVQAIAKGQNFGIFDLVVQITVFIVIRQVLKNPPRVDTLAPGDLTRPSTTARRRLRAAQSLRKPHGLRYGLVAGVGVALFVLVFSNTMSSRVGDHYDYSLASGADGAEVNYDSIAWQLLPPSMRSPALSLTYYVAHGYAGLSLSRDIPFASTYGLGSSAFIANNVQEMLGLDLSSSSYLYRIQTEYGYDAEAKWHTAYLWIANDVSPYGVPVVLFGLMLLFGFAWKDFLVNGNLLAVLLMGVFAIFVGFISANNHAFSEPNSLLAFWVVLFVWILTRRKFDWSGLTQHNA